MMASYRIVLADDHALFRRGLRSLISRRSDFEIVGEAGDGLELVKLMKNGLAGDLIILDISMPSLRGIEVIPEIRALLPNMKVLVVTMHDHKEYLYQALAAGADGYFLKKDAETELFIAMEKIRRGGVYVSPYFSQEIAGNWEEIRQRLFKPVLTPREKEVLGLIAGGKPNKDIAESLFVSALTIKRHRANIMGKLNLKNTAELVKYAIDHCYV